MPYIPSRRRTKINAKLDHVHYRLDTPGELAYAVYMLVNEFVKRQGGDYRAYAGAIGAVYTTLHEFIRQSLNVYEDGKRKQNGGIR